MRPAIDGDRRNVARAGKPARTEHAVELIANAHLEIGESHGEELGLAEVKLRPGIEAGIRRPWHVDEMENDRLRRIARMTIAAEIDRKVERDMTEKARRRGNVGNLERDPGLPIVDDDIGIDQRRLDVARQRLA